MRRIVPPRRLYRHPLLLLGFWFLSRNQVGASRCLELLEKMTLHFLFVLPPILFLSTLVNAPFVLQVPYRVVLLGTIPTSDFVEVGVQTEESLEDGREVRRAISMVGDSARRIEQIQEAQAGLISVVDLLATQIAMTSLRGSLFLPTTLEGGSDIGDSGLAELDGSSDAT